MLTAGENFLHYDIISAIGEGGMGEVYLAKDRHLERKVAIKLLRKKFVNNEAGLRRFVLEAKAASALNHPNIITIYEIGRSDDSQYIATEYIEGHTLHKLLAMDGLDLDDILNITIQVAEALNAAHNAGIVHRDIKPENIMVRKDGYVKVLDFGLAKLLDQEDVPIDVSAKTQKMFETNPGVIMGTVSYMSPEQARGKAVDTRSDIWSLGVVLFQMLTGRLPFTGETTSDMIAALLRSRAPKLSEYIPDCNAELENIVGDALQTEIEDRYQDIRDMSADLKNVRQKMNLLAGYVGAAMDSTVILDDPIDTGKRSRLRSTIGSTPGRRTHSISEIIFTQLRIHPKTTFIGVIITITLMAAVMLGLNRIIRNYQGVKIFQSMRFTKLTSAGNVDSGNVAISPDGKYISYVVQESGQASLWIKQFANNTGVEIVSPESVTYDGLVFSRDGNSIFYVVAGQTGAAEIRQIPTLGGASRKIASDARGPLALSADGKQLAFIRGQKDLMSVGIDGADIKTIATCSDCKVWSLPAWSPDGKKIICAFFDLNTVERLVEISVENGEQKPFSSTEWQILNSLLWTPDGKNLVLAGRDIDSRLSQVWQISYPDGNAVRVTNDLSNYQGLSLADGGATAVSIQENRLSNIWVAPENEMASPDRITTEIGTDDGLAGIAWTPDGQIIYTSLKNGSEDLWIVDRDGKKNRQLTFNSKDSFAPAVSPDGRTIVFVSVRGGHVDLWKMNIDGTDQVQLTNSPEIESYPDFSTDGQWIYYQRSEKNSKPTVWKIEINGGKPVQFLNVESGRPRVSPDGKYIACFYGNNDSYPARIAIIPVAGGTPIKIFNIPSVMYRWSADSRSLVYIHTTAPASQIWSLSLDSGKTKVLADFKTDHIKRFDLSRYGGGIAMALGRETSDVVAITNLK